MKRLMMVLIIVGIGAFLWGQIPDPEELIYWDFQNSLEPEFVNWYIMEASDISISTGDILFMNGTDGGNSRIGYAPDSLWSQELQPDFDDEKFIQFSFRPRINYAIHLRNIEFRFGRNEIGPRAFAAQYSLDGFNTPGETFLSQEITSENPNALNGFAFDFQNAGLRYRGPNFKLTIRIWFYGALEDEDDEVEDDQTLYMNNFRVNGWIAPFPAVALVMDRSGSMGTLNGGSNYWPAARNTAQLFVNEVLYDLDAVCVVSYAVDEFVYGEIHAEVEFPMRHSPRRISQLWPVRTNPDSTVLRLDLHNTIRDIDLPVRGRTSIGSGLIVGMEELFEVYEKMPGKAAMLLLSDGLDNWNPMARHIVPELPDSIAVYTITLGNTTDFNLMRWIARETDGAWVHTPNVDLLREVYMHLYLAGIEQLQNSYTAYQTIAANQRQVHNVVIDNSTGQVKFLIATEEDDEGQPATLIDFTLISPSGRVIDRMSAMDNNSINYSESFNAKTYELWLPEKGVWQLVISGNTIAEEQNYIVSAYSHSSLTMGFEIGEDEHRINEPATFIVNLNDNNMPINADRVTVTVFRNEEDTRNQHYSDPRGTPFEDYEPDKVVNTLIERTRNPEEGIEVVLNQTAPGRYEGIFTESGIVGPYVLRIQAYSHSEENPFNRQSISALYIAPPEPVAIPHLAAPYDNEDGLDTEINFVWSNVLSADSYHFQLANRQEILIDVNGIEANNFLIDTLDYQTEYTWRVKAIKGELESYWSQIFSFTTGVPEIPAPHTLQGNVENNAVVLNWEAPEEEHHYYGPVFAYWVYRDNNLMGAVNPANPQYVDQYVYPGNVYTYHVVATYDNDNWVSPPTNSVEVRMTSVDSDNDIPLVTGIQGNYPNPFNPETNIMFALSEPGFAEVAIYNIMGQKVRTLISTNMEAGNHSIVWNALDENNKNVTSGVYLIKMETTGYSGYRKVLLLK